VSWRFHLPQIHLYIHRDTHVQDQEGRTLLRLWEGEISNSLLTTLCTSTNRLVEEYPPPKGDTSRGDDERYHFGHWKKFQEEPYEISETKHPAARMWISQNTKLWQKLAKVFKSFDSRLFTRYQNGLDYWGIRSYFPPWFSLALNIDFAATPHKDEHDYRSGYCWVLTFGQFRGGALRLKELNATIQMKAGNLVCFKSHLFTHWVEKYSGIRNSIVMFTHDELFIPVPSSFKCELPSTQSNREPKDEVPTDSVN